VHEGTAQRLKGSLAKDEGMETIKRQDQALSSQYNSISAWFVEVKSVAHPKIITIPHDNLSTMSTSLNLATPNLNNKTEHPQSNIYNERRENRVDADQSSAGASKTLNKRQPVRLDIINQIKIM